MIEDALYQIPLFEDISDDELEWLIANSEEVYLNTGDYFIKEHDVDVRFYIVLEGELQVTRQVQGVVKVLGTTPRGITGGQLNLLNDTPAEQTVQAIMPSRLMVFEPDAFRTIFSVCPKVGSRVLRIASERMSMILSQTTQHEKMAALGKFSAGLAHELNNPASAAQRSSQILYDLLPQLQAKTMGLCALGLDDPHFYELLVWERETAQKAANMTPLPPMEQSDREDELGAWLEDIGLDNAYESASVFVTSGVTLQNLQDLLARLPEESMVGVMEWAHSALYAENLLCEIDDTTTRISELVKAVKEYTYMDQGKVQEVDIHKSLETTLKVLAYKVKRVEITREYDPELPPIWANGGELNQVWTNLIDNAVDAAKDQPDGHIRLITRRETDFVMVEINDNGVGIPEDVIPHIFEPFFTTKEIGKGTGLGLDIVYRIVRQHRGAIDVQSHPGNTRFIVRLPIGHSSGNGHVEGE